MKWLVRDLYTQHVQRKKITNMKLLCVDLDGTLLDSSKNISPATLSAIDEMVAAGNHFAIVTGRPLQSALIVAKENNLSRPGMYVASFNGGQIYDCANEKIIHEERMSLEHFKAVFKKAKEAGLHIHTYDDTHVICDKQSPELDYYLKHIRLEGKIVKDPITYLDKPPIKLIVMSLAGREILESFRDSIMEYTKEKLSSIFSHPTLLEYSSPSLGKGKAVEMLCQLCKVEIADAIAVGDEENDITMLKAAGIGVAMANATELVKQNADYITVNDNDHDGVLEVINKFILK